MQAYALLEKLRTAKKDPSIVVDAADKAAFEEKKVDLGYGLLLKPYTEKIVDATDEMVKQAAKDSIPNVAPLFYSFRVMVALGFLMLLVFAAAFWQSTRHQIEEKPWVLKAALYSLPLPWIAIECGWFVAEYGRQPWTISEVLPTYMSASTLSVGDLWFSIITATLIYTVLLVIELYLMIKFARRGPSSLKTGRYHFEKLEA
jgi:cytochrome d ubiquinol oxidase subunit I